MSLPDSPSQDPEPKLETGFSECLDCKNEVYCNVCESCNFCQRQAYFKYASKIATLQTENISTQSRLQNYKELVEKLKGFISETSKCSPDLYKWGTILEIHKAIQAFENNPNEERKMK